MGKGIKLENVDVYMLDDKGNEIKLPYGFTLTSLSYKPTIIERIKNTIAFIKFKLINSKKYTIKCKFKGECKWQ